jgi:hypothetical protein
LFFPRPYEDELTGSLLIRALRRLGLTLRELNHILTGRTRPDNSVAFLTPVLLPEIGRLTGMTPRSLLWKHTIFPYACITLERQEAEVQEASLILDVPAVGEHLPLRLNSIYPPEIKLTSFRRYCEDCRDEEMERFGESYWHVSHALPAVAACPKHKGALRVCDIRLTSQTIGAQNQLPHEMPPAQGTPQGHRDILLAIAEQSERALRGSYALTALLRPGYRVAAESLGYDCGRYAENRYRLVADLERWFGAGLLEDIGVPTRSGAPTAWPLTLIGGRHSSPQAQLKHVLLRVFLEHVAGSATPWAEVGNAVRKPSRNISSPAGIRTYRQ